MRVLDPAPRRSRSERSIHGLRISVPTHKSVIVLAFLGLWLCGWVLGGIVAVVQIILQARNADIAQVGFLVVWLSFWTIGGVIAGGTWLWMAFGQTLLIAENSVFTIRREVLGIGRDKHYAPSSVNRLRIQSHPNPLDPFGMMRNFEKGPIAFDYGAKTIFFGQGLDEAEARIVQGEIAQELGLSV